MANWVIPLVVIPAGAGMDGLNHWIPACAGMTKGVEVKNLSGIAKGLSGWQPTFSLLVVIPAKAGIQEGRPGGGEGMAEFARWRIG